VGSALDLFKRFRVYYSLVIIERILSKSKSHIFSAILKYGYSNFILEILEYSEPKVLINREQYFIDTIDP
jgi:group I intron endonuclease